MRLNGWQRLGIIASVAWMLFGAYQGNEYGLRQGDPAIQAQISCDEIGELSVSACQQEFDQTWVEDVSGHWDDAALFAFVPIALGWLGAWAIIKLVRWVRRGFRAPQP